MGHHISGQVKTVNTNPVVQEPFPDISIQHHSPHIEIFRGEICGKYKIQSTLLAATRCLAIFENALQAKPGTM
jgi:hypothetical protein